jgi:WD40 repeat protein
VGPQVGVIYVCITTIDTIILYIHTNDAYTYDTYTPLRRRKLYYTLPAHTNIISSCAYSKSGELLLTCSFDGCLKIYGSRSFNILRTLTGHSGRVMACAFAPDERHVASAGFDRTIKLWAHKDEF